MDKLKAQRQQMSPLGWALLCGAALIGQQVASKAARDALFLSNFDVTSLPVMMVASALLSIAVVLLTSQGMRRFGPASVMPWAFTSSAVLLLAIWALGTALPRLSSVFLYLHVAAVGAILVSGFWSVVNEAFDRHAGKHAIQRIGMATTFGGLVGGLAAERVAAIVSVTWMLPILAALHALCAVTVTRLQPLEEESLAPASLEKTRDPVSAQRVVREGTLTSMRRILRETPYLRHLGALILVVTMGAALLDYVLKSRAAQHFDDPASLMRFFALFYTAVSLGTFLIQTIAARVSIERLGLAKTVAVHPVLMGLGAVLTYFVPGVLSAALARGVEVALRSSLFRSAYETLFMPIAPRDKRATKTLVDVGFERAGDVLGGSVVRLLLFFPSQIAVGLMLAIAAVVGIIGALLTRRLQQGYQNELGNRLLSGQFKFDLDGIDDPMSRTMLIQTQSFVGLTSKSSPILSSKPTAQQPLDARAARIAELHSGDPARVLMALADGAIDAQLVQGVTPLLAWDAVQGRVADALIACDDDIVPNLAKALGDVDEEFAIRRRLPRVLSHFAVPQAVDGLLAGLRDKRFEVRYRCGQALARLRRKDPELHVDPPRVFDCVLRETRVDRGVWESQRLLDRMEEADAPFVDDILRQRSNRSLEHVFTMLSLALDTKLLVIAYKGLLTNDVLLRSTALEYLESTLPAAIRTAIWPFLDDSRPSDKPQRSRDEILESLMNSHHSIQIQLDTLRNSPPEDSA